MRFRLPVAAIAAATLLSIVPVAEAVTAQPQHAATAAGPEAGPTAAARHYANPTAAEEHDDPAPPGVDVHQHLSTADLFRRAGLSATASALGLLSPRALGPGVAAASPTSPTGTPDSPYLTRHVPPSCTGDGADGNRVQVMYAREAGTTDRFAAVLPILRNEVANVDDAFALSARETGGGRRVRWVHDAACVPVITEVVLPAGSLSANFGATIDAMHAAGYTSSARKYLLFADAAQLCGIAELYGDSTPSGNYNDGMAAMVARVDTGCWSGRPDHSSTMAHELMHNLGGVQNDAPHSTGAGHCNDQQEVMCYADGGPRGTMTQTCPLAHAALYDCGHDDYFTTATPAPGTYLADHWNTASSSFLDDAPVLPGAPPVTLTASSTTVETGDTLTVTATAPGATMFSWDGPYAGTVTSSPGTSTLAVGASPYWNTGTHTYTVSAATSDGIASVATIQVAVSQAAGPTVTVAGPITPALAGRPFVLTAHPVGKAPFTYQWGVPSPCTATGMDTPAVTVTCPAGQAVMLGYGLSVSQADQAMTSTNGTVVVTAPTPVDPTPTPTPTPTRTPTPVTRTATGITTVVRVGRPDTITGRVTTRGGAALANVPVTLQYRPATSGTWRNLTTVTADRTGTATAHVQPGAVTYYRWVYAGNDTYAGATTGQVLVKVTTAASLAVRSGRPDTVTGRVTTASGSSVGYARVTLQARAAGGSTWRGLTTLTANRYGSVTARVQPKRGTYYRWVYAGSGTFYGATSGQGYVRY